jgi:hypothetical protein
LLVQVGNSRDIHDRAGNIEGAAVFFAASVVVLPFRDTATSKEVFPLSAHPDNMRSAIKMRRRFALKNCIAILCSPHANHHVLF